MYSTQAEHMPAANVTIFPLGQGAEKHPCKKEEVTRGDVHSYNRLNNTAVCSFHQLEYES
jgi:hypothetical protein